MHRRSRILTATLLSAGLMASSPGAWATNGYFTHGVGTKNKGMAGAGTAAPEEVISIANNPAGLAFIEERTELGLGLFSPMRSYNNTDAAGRPPLGECFAPGQCLFSLGSDSAGPNNLDSDNELFFIPNFAMNWNLSDQNHLAFAFYARGGMNTEWKGGTATYNPTFGGVLGPDQGAQSFPGTYGAGDAGVDLSQAFMNLTFARSSQDKSFSWGVSAIIAMQLFEAKGVDTFAPFTKTFVESYFTTGTPVMPTNLASNGHEWSYGAGLAAGIMWQPSRQFSLSAAYTSKMNMTEFDKYSDLFAESGDFDIPSNATIGIAFRASDALMLALDVQQIWYSDVASVSNPVQNLFNCPIFNPQGSFESCLGGNDGGGFGWDDMTVYKLGVQWEQNSIWTWRAGYSHGKQPIGPDQMTFNILAPGVIEDHITLGFTRQSGDKAEYSLSFMWGLDNEVSGPNQFDQFQTVNASMYQWELEFSYAWKR
jgi:long-chain fatty acid transport protein